jgi:hypothetical protein
MFIVFDLVIIPLQIGSEYLLVFDRGAAAEIEISHIFTSVK